jgi:hypothetical protein
MRATVNRQGVGLPSAQVGISFRVFDRCLSMQCIGAVRFAEIEVKSPGPQVEEFFSGWEGHLRTWERDLSRWALDLSALSSGRRQPGCQRAEGKPRIIRIERMETAAVGENHEDTKDTKAHCARTDYAPGLMVEYCTLWSRGNWSARSVCVSNWSSQLKVRL